VNDTQKFGPYVLHIGTANGTVAVGAEVECSPDFIRRHKLAANHTMTHVRLLPLLPLLPLLLFLFFPSFRCRSRLYQVLNLALRTHVGPDCNQKGSEVTTAKFRFDFSNSNPVTYEQIEKIEDQVRAIISHGAVVYKRTCSLADARRIRTLARFSARSTLTLFELSLSALTSMRCLLNQTLTNGTQFLLSSAEART